MVWAPGVLLALVSHGSLASLVFGLPTIRRGGEGSPQYDSHKVARASGDARRRARPRTPAVPLHAVGAARPPAHAAADSYPPATPST